MHIPDFIIIIKIISAQVIYIILFIQIFGKINNFIYAEIFHVVDTLKLDRRGKKCSRFAIMGPIISWPRLQVKK